MLAEKNVKPVAALSVLAVPWDVFVFGANLGWGVTLLYGRVVNSSFGPWFASPLQLLDTYSSVPAGQTGLLVTGGWLLAAVVATAGAGLAVVARARGGPTVRQDRLVGIALAGAGLLFVLTRVAGNGRLMWTALPVGAFYAVGVGTLFYRDRFGDWLAALAAVVERSGAAGTW